MDIKFGPGHPTHRRVSWPEDIENATIQLPSSFPKFLACNTELSASEADQVKDLQIQIQAKQVTVELCIQRLKNELSQAEYEREQLSKQYFACKVSLAPIRTLPPDIICQVVQHLPRYISETTHVPTVLSQVSALWRITVRGFPHAWDFVRLSTRGPAERMSVIERRLQHFGRLSGSVPLTIKLYETRPSPDYSSIQFLNWILYSWKDSARVRTLDINMEPSSSKILGASSNNIGPVFKIQTLRIYNSHRSRESLTPILDLGPSLSRLWLEEGTPWDLDHPLPENLHSFCSWSNITRLYAINYKTRLEAFWNILVLCPRLEIVCMSVPLVSSDGTMLTPSKTIVHSHLKELGLDIHMPLHAGSMYTALSRCCFPSVTSLFYAVFILTQAEQGSETSVAVPDPSDALRIFPSLETLRMTDYVHDEVFLRSVLCPLSTLTNLIIIFHQGEYHPSFNGIKSLLRPTERVYTNMGTAVESYLAPKLIKLTFRIVLYRPEAKWGEDDQESAVYWITELKKSRPSIAVTVECEMPVGYHKGDPEKERQRQLLSTLPEKFKELGVDIDFKMKEIHSGFEFKTPHPLQDTLRDHFIRFFD